MVTFKPFAFFRSLTTFGRGKVAAAPPSLNAVLAGHLGELHVNGYLPRVTMLAALKGSHVKQATAIAFHWPTPGVPSEVASLLKANSVTIPVKMPMVDALGITRYIQPGIPSTHRGQFLLFKADDFLPDGAK